MIYLSRTNLAQPALLLLLIAITATANGQHATLESGRTVTGKTVTGVERIDNAIDEFMTSIDCQAATIAVFGNGLRFARGYGTSDEAKEIPTLPTTTMRIASCTKPITAAAIRTLIRQGKISESTLAFDYLKIKPFGGKIGDDRLRKITIKQLLQHSGGFDRSKSGDPMFRLHEFQQAMKLAAPPTTTQIIEYMLMQPLDFEPGSKSVYSNFGFCVLGRIIEQASGKSYLEYVNETIAKKIGVSEIRLTHSRQEDRPPIEVWYPINDDSLNVEVLDSVGGLAVSSPTLIAFLHYYLVDGQPRKKRKGTHGVFFGSLPGTTAFIEHRPDGIDVAVLLNNRRNRHFNADNSRLRKTINAAIDELKKARPTGETKPQLKE